MPVCKVRFPFHSCTILELFGYSHAISMLLLCWRNALSYHLFFFPYFDAWPALFALEFLEKMAKPDSSNFFLDPIQFWTVKLARNCKWQKVFSFHFFTFTSFLGLKMEAGESSRSWTKIKLNLLNCSCIACKTLSCARNVRNLIKRKNSSFWTIIFQWSDFKLPDVANNVRKLDHYLIISYSSLAPNAESYVIYSQILNLLLANFFSF